MIYQATGFRYWWRRYLGWFPVQWCMVCGRPYWGGWPWPFRWPAAWHWMPWWKDYCSQQCCDIDELEIDSDNLKLEYK